jgi:membrane protein involved in colicin uptake
LNSISVRSAVALGVVAAPAAVAVTDEDKTIEAPASAAVPDAPFAAELRIRSDVRRAASRQVARRRARATRRAHADRRARARKRARGRRAPAAVQSTAPPGLQAIGACESGGNPSAVGGGGAYRGKYQFDYSTWVSVGGTGDPAVASEAEQDSRAAILYARAGSSPWPVCGGCRTAP